MNELMNYREVIYSKEELKDFHDNLEKLNEGEVYVITSIARKKWGKLARSEEVLQRDLVTSNDFNHFYRKLLRFKVPVESYVDSNGEPIGEEVIGYYIDLNKKGSMEGVKRFVKEELDLLLSSNECNNRHYSKCFAMMLSAIARSDSKLSKKVMMLDIDKKDKELLNDMIRELSEKHIQIYAVHETRGGYHIILKANKSWEILYKEVLPKMSKNNNVEWKKCITPIPGTLQGGFKVKNLGVKE